MTPAGSTSRTTTLVAAVRPLLPTTKVYLRPPWQRLGASGPGQERAQTGSGLSALVIVRSTAGLTVVTSEAVFDTPVFLTLPVTVAVLKIVDPADERTVPVIVTVSVPPEFSERIEHLTCGAITAQPLPLPSVPLT